MLIELEFLIANEKKPWRKIEKERERVYLV